MIRPADNATVRLHAGPNCYFGMVVPKRHARRAVTRNLLKRQAWAVARLNQGWLDAGLYLVRLRSAFPLDDFIAADSARLRGAALGELQQLFSGLKQRRARAAAAAAGRADQAPPEVPR